MKIDGTIELVKEGSKGMSTGDWVSIIVSILALVGIIISTIITVISNNKNQRKRMDFEKKLGDKEINANIRSSAIIDWMGNVKDITTNLVTSLTEFSENDEEVQWITVYRYISLLILQFGPNDKKHNTDKLEGKLIDLPSNYKTILYNQKDNHNKNDYIVDWLNELKSHVKRNKLTFSKTYQEIEVIRDAAAFRLFQLDLLEIEVTDKNINAENIKETMDKEDYTLIDINEEKDDDDDIDFEEIVGGNNVIEAIEKYKEYEDCIVALENYEEIREYYQLASDKIIEIIRIYLKIEWDKAKKYNFENEENNSSNKK
ncbi:hypothetical protein JNUCC83_04665 [Vagococcus sp. JNUCC 83]